MKYKQRIILEIERYPENCKECPAFYQHPYTCHNERGMEADCRLGYMCDDMRDFSGDRLYNKCDIRNNPDVAIMEECK